MKKAFLVLLAVLLIAVVMGGGYMFYMSQTGKAMAVKSETVQIASGGQSYPAYVAAPETGGKFPAVVLVHSFNGLEAGYKTMVENLASEGYVVIAPEWQTFGQRPMDEVVKQVIADSVMYLKTRGDVDSAKLGLTGFCAGGRYTMLFLPQMPEFKTGLAWYGFPYSGGFNNQSLPVDFVLQLNVPMLMIHGTADQAANISDIYRYATALDQAGKYFELKVYQGEPHGFMIQNGTLAQSFPAKDAYGQMVTWFNRTLK